MAVAKSQSSGTFSEEERAAMKERALELKAGKLDGEKMIQAKIDEMPEPDRSMAKKIHALVGKYAPGLKPRTWYGMPAYTKNEKVVLFFKGAYKYKSRYATLGFEEMSTLDDGNMWPTSYALVKLTPAEETVIIHLIKKAAG